MTVESQHAQEAKLQIHTENPTESREVVIDAARLLNELQTLATFTSIEQPSEGTAVTRVLFTPDDLRARAWLKQLAESEGLVIREDAVGNTFSAGLAPSPTSPPSPPARISTPSHTPECTMARSAFSAA